MPAYVITEKNEDLLETTVFQGEDGAESVAVFNSREVAEDYLAAANWKDSGTVAELRGADFLVWLGEAYREGVRYLAVDPCRDQQQRGQRQDVLDIEAHLEEAAAKILRVAGPEC